MKTIAISPFRLFALSPFRLFALSLFCLASCMERDPTKRVSEDPFVEAPLHLSYNVRVVFMDSLNTKAILTAGEARVFEDRKQTLLGKHVHVDFYDVETNKKGAELDADSAEVDERTKNMVAIGNVRVWSDSSRTELLTTRLLWDEKVRRVSTNERVRITSPTESIDGIGMESDQYLTSYRIFKVSGVHKQ